MTSSRSELRLGMVLLGLSGAAALGHQVLWTRRLTDLIGAGVESSARVLEGFFLGFALGAAVAAWVLPNVRRPWRAAACAELGVALLSLPILFLPTWAGWIWPALGPNGLVGWQGSVVRAAVSILAIVPPALLMGLILPLVTEAVGAIEASRRSCPVALYAAYTLGGALGLALVVGLVLHRVGVEGSMLLMTGLSAGVSLLCFGWDRRVGPTRRPTDSTSEAHLRPSSVSASRRPRCPPPSVPRPATIESSPEGGEAWNRRGQNSTCSPRVPRGEDSGAVPAGSSQGRGEWRVLLLAMGSGFGVLALEVLGLALLNLKMPLAFYTPAAVLVCVVLVLGLSAVVSPRVAHGCGGVSRLLPCALAVTGVMAAAAPGLFLITTGGQAGIMVHGSGIAGGLLRLGAVAGVSLGPALLAAGLVFPLLLNGDPGGAGNGSSGRWVGRLLAVNGVGGILGAETAIRVLLPAGGVHQGLGVVGGFYLVLSGAAFLAWGRQRIQIRWVLLLLVGTGIVCGGFLKPLPLFLRTATFRVLEVRSGGEGSLAVVERADVGRAMFLDNLYLLGGSRAAVDLERQAHLPLLLHPAPRRVAFIGMGTGITAGGALHHQAVESVDIAEVSALVAGAAARHFREFNQGVCEHPKVRVHVEDGGPYLAAARSRFDVIVGDLFIPWRPGEARLCSLEQFQAAKGALRPQGLFCQWLPMAQLTEEDFMTILATFHRVFGGVHLFRGHFRTRSLPLALVAFDGGGLDWDVVSARCRAERDHGALKDPACRHPEGVAMLYAGTWAPEGRVAYPLNTLGNLRVELHAGRHTLEGSPEDYWHGDGDRWLRFLERQVMAISCDREMPGTLRPLPALGLLTARWEIAVERDDPSALMLRRAVLAGIPGDVRDDPGADWAFWPGRRPLESSPP